MPNQYIYDNESGTFTLNDNEQLLVASTGSIVNTGMNVSIKVTGSGNTVNVLGTVFSGSSGILLGDTAAADNNNRLFIGESGYINGSFNQFAIAALGYNSIIENAGVVWNRSGGNSSGVLIGSSHVPGETRLINSGTIEASSVAVAYEGNEKAYIENSGLIKGSDYFVL